MSSYKGVQNVRIVKQAGQEYMAKVIEGMTPIPASWGIPSTGHAGIGVIPSITFAIYSCPECSYC
jgi:hypothetical protein